MTWWYSQAWHYHRKRYATNNLLSSVLPRSIFLREILKRDVASARVVPDLDNASAQRGADGAILPLSSRSFISGSILCSPQYLAAIMLLHGWRGILRGYSLVVVVIASIVD